MKILLIHTYYQQKGGEDGVFRLEQLLLGQTEHVRTLTFQNLSGWRGAAQFLLSLWNVTAAKKLKKAISEYRPDIIHMHNLHFAIGPIAIRVANKAGIPVVLTLHNYRLLCPSTTLISKGRLFTDSVNASFPWKAVANKAYRNSVFQTFWLAFVVWFHKKAGTWKMVNKYIVLTDFAKTLFVNSSFGVSEQKYVVKPNFVDSIDQQPAKRMDRFLFIGRLSHEKGIQLLLDAFRHIDDELYVAGDGPLKEELELACKQNGNIKYAGSLDSDGVREAMKHCVALIFPSIWYEGMPMTLLEAFASGTPVIAGNLGAMSSMVQHGYNGLHFQPGQTEDLIVQVKYWQSLSHEEKYAYSVNARTTYESFYTPGSNLEKCLTIYQSVINPPRDFKVTQN